MKLATNTSDDVKRASKFFTLEADTSYELYLPVTLRFASQTEIRQPGCLERPSLGQQELKLPTDARGSIFMLPIVLGTWFVAWLSRRNRRE